MPTLIAVTSGCVTEIFSLGAQIRSATQKRNRHENTLVSTSLVYNFTVCVGRSATIGASCSGQISFPPNVKPHQMGSTRTQHNTQRRRGTCPVELVEWVYSIAMLIVTFQAVFLCLGGNARKILRTVLIFTKQSMEEIL